MEDVERSSTLARVGDACAMALAGASLAALPMALRAHTAGGGLLDAFVIAAAVMACVLTPVALTLPKAARGWRGVVGQSPSRRVVVGLGLWVALTGAMLTFLGTFLKAKTHHKGLGGATFGVFGLVAALVLAVLVVRALDVERRLEARPSLRWPLWVGGALLVVGCLAVVGVPLARADDLGITLARAAVFDVLLTAVVIAVLLPRRAPKAIAAITKVIALPVTLSLVVIGFVRVETSTTPSFMKAGGGMVPAILGALESWTDRDGDGVGSHFGGRDCDEGDPTKNPLAVDTAGDGIDHDCDGRDGLEPVETKVAASEPPPPEDGTATPTAASADTVVASAPQPPDKPDVIVVTLDTVRADRTTLYGYDKATTPELAKLAERGVVFEHAYAAGSNTQRALMPVISGNTFSATPHTNVEWPRIRDEALTVAERVKTAGYNTGAVSSFTWIRADRGFAQGFDVFDQSAWKDRHPEREPTGDLAIDAAVALHAKLSADKAPLYLWVHLFDPHQSYVEHAGIDFGKTPSDKYDGELAFMDRQLGRLIAAVEKGPRSGRTVWIVHGTHGEAFGEHGQMGHGTQLYEESIRVPFFAVTPWSQPKRYDTAAVSVLDVAATVLDLTGGKSDGTVGVSLAPVLQGKPFERAPVLAYANRRVAVVDWPLKLMVFRRKEGRDRLLLFDLEQDPGEGKDRAAEDKEALVRLDAFRTKAEESSSDE